MFRAARAKVCVFDITTKEKKRRSRNLDLPCPSDQSLLCILTNRYHLANATSHTGKVNRATQTHSVLTTPSLFARLRHSNQLPPSPSTVCLMHRPCPASCPPPPRLDLPFSSRNTASTSHLPTAFSASFLFVPNLPSLIETPVDLTQPHRRSVKKWCFRSSQNDDDSVILRRRRRVGRFPSRESSDHVERSVL